SFGISTNKENIVLWWFFRGLTSRHRSDLVRSAFNGGRLCFGGGTPVIVDSSGMVSKTGFLVLGWRALVPEISTSDSSLFFATNEKLKYQESILGLQRVPWRLPSSSLPVTASVASISAVRCFGSCPVVLAPLSCRVWWKWRVYHPLVYPNKSGCGIDVGVLVVPGLTGCWSFLIPLNFRREEQRWLFAVIGVWGFDRLWFVGFHHFGAAPLSSAASSEFLLVSLLSVGGRASW
ncbi:LOW QUALITY PROTEIN: hypothetical protein HID58_083416, partial [Brassica napus]